MPSATPRCLLGSAVLRAVRGRLSTLPAFPSVSPLAVARRPCAPPASAAFAPPAYCALPSPAPAKAAEEDAEQSRYERPAGVAQAGNAAGADLSQPDAQPQNEFFYPKKYIAMLMAYSGKGFWGMQTHKGSEYRTIESELVRALVEIGSLRPSNAGDPKKMKLQRASRTDKGVHAAQQIIGIKTGVGIKDFVVKLNAKLPSSIKVFGVEAELVRASAPFLLPSAERVVADIRVPDADVRAGPRKQWQIPGAVRDVGRDQDRRTMHAVQCDPPGGRRDQLVSDLNREA
ncbi:MAG: pseudouridine synthase [Olpidium bornovanus]|uniref:Pseudouridine synthase n=1 Tax=Olpidium bornovanus TaxID=278681 RepID=A0A8H7ZP35_9FUNG|nr:MAG: pseudouridine synthase [Olpidium bornovanus]